MEGEKVEVSKGIRFDRENDRRLMDRCRGMDLTMLSILNARERDADDWESLFKEADPRFKFHGVKRSTGSNLAIMEAIWDSQTKASKDS